MPLDAICISALTEELKPVLEGGKIDKIQQPERDLLILSLRTQGKNLKLLIAAGTGNARIHFTQSSFENPSEPPMFCMLLRKHLTGSKINYLYQPENERMLVIGLDAHDELGFNVEKRLIVEMMGRNSNVILTDAEGRIVDCMRRVDFAGDALRRLLPGMLYREPPKQSKPLIFETDFSDIRNMLLSADREKPVYKWLMDNFSGLSPLICRELAFRAGDNYDRLPDLLPVFIESVKAREFLPCLIYEDGKAADFSFMAITQYGSAAHCEVLDSFSELLETFYSARDKAELQRRKSHELTKTVRTMRDRLERKLSNQREELKRTGSREALRRNAELITANIYRLKRGDRSLTCENYYEENCPQVTIQLDPLKTPQQNAAAMFKENNKLKAAEIHLTKFIYDGARQLDYLNSVLDELSRAETEKDVSDIRRELISTGYIKKIKNSKQEKIKPQTPHCYVSTDGFEILVGRSNAQNDELTFKTARRTDYWLHAQKIHGSHVVIRCGGTEPPETTIMQAASLAAWYSQGRGSGKLAVDCTMIRNVHKPSGALPGMVIYTDYRTVIVQTDEKNISEIKKG